MSVFIGVDGSSGVASNALSKVFRRDGFIWTLVLSIDGELNFGTYEPYHIGTICVSGDNIYVFAVSNVDSAVVLYRSSTNGANWSSTISQPLFSIPDVSIDTLGRLYAHRDNGDANDGVWRSTDEGSNWTKISGFDEASGGAAVEGLWTCEDYTYWIELVPNITLIRLDNLTLVLSTLDLTGGDDMFVNGLDDDLVLVWASTFSSGGPSHEVVGMIDSLLPKPTGHIFVYVHPLDASIYVALTYDTTLGDNHIYRSTDGGNTWVEELANAGTQSFGESRERRITHEGINVFAISGEISNPALNVYISTDSGASWNTESFTAPLSSVACLSRQACAAPVVAEGFVFGSVM